MILVTAKINPDLDGVACALAYAELLNLQGNAAEGIILGTPQSEVSYFIDQHVIRVPTRNEHTPGSWIQFVLVDASSMKGMPKPVIPEQVIEIVSQALNTLVEKGWTTLKPALLRKQIIPKVRSYTSIHDRE